MSKLGGSTFVWRGNDQDYCFRETIHCLAELCDEISIAAGGPDGTPDDVFELLNKLSKQYPEKKMSYYRISQEEWESQQGREKLSFFSNIAISRLESEYNFYLQCDEILSEDSFEYVRCAIETGQEAFFMRRLNLWRTPLQMLNVSQDRKPCSTEVIRLAKTKYGCIDDAESLGVSECCVFGEIDLMTIFHMGFVRDPKKHLVKIRHVLVDVFQFEENDKRAENCSEFQPDRWFDPEKDLVPIPRSLPKFIKVWCKERYPKLIIE